MTQSNSDDRMHTYLSILSIYLGHYTLVIGAAHVCLLCVYNDVSMVCAICVQCYIIYIDRHISIYNILNIHYLCILYYYI